MKEKHIFNGSETQLLEYINKIVLKQNEEKKFVSCILENGVITISVNNISTKLSLNRIRYIPRTFSMPTDIKYAIEVSSSDMSNDFIEGILKAACEAYSPSEIEAIIQDMPLLKQYSLEQYDLSKYSIIWRDHFLEENIGLLNSFVRMGVHPDNIIALDKGDSTKHREQITKTFQLLGYRTAIFDNACLNSDEKHKEYKELLTDFLKDKEEKSVLVLDDGAIVTGLLEQNMASKILFAIELTEMGLRRIKTLDLLPCKIYNLAKTDLKKLFTYKEVANSVFIKIVELLGAKKIIGRTAMIIGYGDLGSMLAENFRSYGMNVVITDLDYKRIVLAAENGFVTYKNLSEAIKDVSPFLVIGTSGYESISALDIENLPDGCFVTSAATADINAFLDIKDNSISTILNYGTQYLVNGKIITLLGNGRSINLYDSEAIPNQANDLFKTATLITLINGVKAQSLERTLDLEVVNSWLEESEIYKSYYERYVRMKEE